MKTFSVVEANRVLPEVERELVSIKKILDDLRHARDQLADLRIIWGDKLETPTCPDRAEYESWNARFIALEEQLGRTLGALRELGAEVKDADAGLVDFYAKRGDDLVYLCWKRGETHIGYWHTLESGYSSRKPIGSL